MKPREDQNYDGWWKFRKIRKEGKFPCAFCRKGGGSDLIQCQIFKCWLQKRCIRGISGISCITGVKG